MTDKACFSCRYYDRAVGAPTGACNAPVRHDHRVDPFWVATAATLTLVVAGVKIKRSHALEPFDGQNCKAWRSKTK